LPPAARNANIPVTASPTSARQPLIAWRPVAAAAVLCAILLGGLILVMRGTPSASNPAAPAEVALAVVPPGDTTPADIPAAPVKVEPAPPAPVAPPPAPPVDSPVPASPPDAVPAAAAPAPAADPVVQGPAEAAAACPVDRRYGTRIDFEDSPAEAAEKALKDKKLLFVLHVAGNFEKDRFT
jgi:hypothetical protein